MLILVLYISKFSPAEITNAIRGFNFAEFNNQYSQLRGEPAPDQSFLEWFIGFVEGDGYISKPSSSNPPRLVITQKELDVLIYIQQIWGSGIISFNPSNNCHYLTFSILEDIYLFSLLFNGNLVLQGKRNQLAVWIELINVKVANPTSSIYGFLPLVMNNSMILPSVADSWFSGFADAEGFFTCSWGVKLRLRFGIDQKDGFSLFRYIVNEFFTFVQVVARHDKPLIARFLIGSHVGRCFVIDYFNRHPLRSKKAKAFDRFVNIHNFVANGFHHTPEGKIWVQEQAKLINPKD